MRTYLLKRLGIALLTLFGMSIVIFVLMRLAPGNIVDILYEAGGYVDPVAKKELTKELGFDRPIVAQYLSWLGDILQGNLGKSYRYDVPAWQIIKPRIPITVELAILSLLVAVLLGVPTGWSAPSARTRPWTTSCG